MNYKKVLYIIIPLLAIAFVVFRLKSNKTEAEKKIYQYNKEQPIHVATERVYEQNIGNVFSFTGSFEPDKESKLSAEVQGKINEIYVDLGQQVAKGQLLVQIDNVLLQQQINAIDVQIEGLSSDVQRYTILANADAVQGIQLEKSVLALKSAKFQKATLLEQLNKTKIVAPFSGVITAKMNEVGAFAAPGVPLLQLTEISVLRFTINVSEMEVSKFQIGKSYPIKIDALPTLSLIGKVEMISSKANVANSFPVQFKVQNTNNNQVKAGMFGKVELTSGSDEKGILIPSSVIVGTAEKPQVYIVKAGKATLAEVQISKRKEDKAIVAKGLKEGDIIITNGFQNLFEGAAISEK